MLAGPGNCLPPDDDPSSMHPESEPSRPARRRSILLVFMTLAVGLGVIGLWGFGGSGSEGTSGGGLVVRNVTIDEPINGKNAAVRLVIDNTTGTTDRLVAVSSDASDAATLHRSVSDDQGRSSMQELSGVAIPAGKKVVFRAGGLHVMLNGLNEPMDIGDTVDLTLTFQHAGTQTVDAEVVPIGENGQEGSDGMVEGHDMSDMGN
jgi:hypothetical protein